MVKFKTLSMAIAGAACVAVGSAIAPSSAEAVTMTNNFRADVTNGSLAGQSFFGNFQYDDAGLTGIGEEILDSSNGLLGVSFNFLGNTYTEQSDSEFPVYPQLTFQDGLFLNLDFIVSESPDFPNPTDIPGQTFQFGTVFATLSNRLFLEVLAGDPAAPDVSFGPITFGIQPEDTATAVPAPAVFPGVLAAGALGAVYRKRQSRKVSA